MGSRTQAVWLAATSVLSVSTVVMASPVAGASSADDVSFDRDFSLWAMSQGVQLTNVACAHDETSVTCYGTTTAGAPFGATAQISDLAWQALENPEIPTTTTVPPSATNAIPQPATEENGRTVTTTAVVRQTLFGDDSGLDVGDLDPTAWQLVSTRFVQDGDELYFFAEMRNASDLPLEAPGLRVEVFDGVASFGTENVFPLSYWVPPGDSAFYQGLNLFGNSLVVGDWNEETFSLFDEPSEVDLTPYDGVRVEGDRVYNDGDMPVPPITFHAVVRDGAGIFLGACSVAETGAVIPPGQDVRAPGLGGTGLAYRCGFVESGSLAAPSLGVDGPETIEYVFDICRYC